MSKQTQCPKNLRYNKSDRLNLEAYVGEELGPNFKVHYKVRGRPAMPRSTGVLGDEGKRGQSVVISTNSEAERRDILSDNVEHLAKVATQMVARTSSVTRVLIDITPGTTHFEIDQESQNN